MVIRGDKVVWGGKITDLRLRMNSNNRRSPPDNDRSYRNGSDGECRCQGAHFVRGGVITHLRGRSSKSRDRATAAGICDVDLTTLVDASIILSIVSPSHALEVAELIAAEMRLASSAAIFIDCNAVSPQTMGEVAQAFDNTDARVLDSGIGAALALKMCCAGINKVAATKSGADKVMMAKLAESQSQRVVKFSKGIPDMYPKAYRWVAETDEIASFLGSDSPAAEIFAGMGAFSSRWRTTAQATVARQQRCRGVARTASSRWQHQPLRCLEQRQL